MTITIQIDKRGDWEQVSFIGAINEDAEIQFTQLPSRLGANVIFNFKRVSNVNSCGVRAWITFLREAQKGRNVIFEECTPEIVSQINMIPNFKGQAHIKSVYGSYACGDCSHNKWELFEEGRNLPQTVENGLPPVKCDKCGAAMELEELEDEFFAWIEAA